MGEGGPDVCPLSHAASRHGAGSVLCKAGACWARKGPWHLREHLGRRAPVALGSGWEGPRRLRERLGGRGPGALGSVWVGGA